MRQASSVKGQSGTAGSHGAQDWGPRELEAGKGGIMKRITLIALAALTAVMLAPVTGASAKTATYAGTTEGDGRVAADVVIKKHKVRKITEARGFNLPAVCEQSGPLPVDATLPGPIKVSKRGKFDVTIEQPVYGNVSRVKGRFDGKKLTGKLDLDAHYPAEGIYPEEDCATGPIEYNAKRGAPDETQG
jgi:hypothetical protein